MRKLSLLFILFAQVVFAGSKVEIYASKIDSQNGTVIASGGVTVVYTDYFLTAKKATYHRESGDLELFKDIRVNYRGKYKILGEYAKMNLAQKERTFKPFYMLDTASEVWMNGKKGYAKDNDIDITSGLVSGCDPIDPMWKVAFSSSDYDAKSMWLNIYNARFYLYDIPIFYTPYFGYSLDTIRRTGLLMPSLGVSQSEGFYYEQPIYIAEQNWWDLELKPQVRTSRGVGGYATYRFVDSSVSKGYLDLGYFREKDSYFTASQVNLKNQKHFGWNFGYTNTDFLNQWFGADLSGQSGVYVDTSYMNDVEYINLATNNAQNQITANQVISRINAFYNTDENYVATYFKYYQNLDKENDDSTLQQLPALHYHHYIDTFLKDHLIYSLDLQSKNLYRKIGANVVRTDINLPILLQGNFLDEYLNLSYKANVYMQHSSFRHRGNYDFQDGYYVRNYHSLKVSTQLMKPYDDFVHIVSFGVSYNKNAQSKETGYYKKYSEFCSQLINQDDPQCEFYNINRISEEANFDFTQYLYDNGGNEFLYHRLSQKVSYENKDRLGELENELDLKLDTHLSYYNNAFYNHQFHRFTKVLNRIDYNHFGLVMNLSHLFKYDIAKAQTNEDPYTKYLTSSFHYKYNTHYSFAGMYNYDIELKQRKAASIGFTYQKRCWEFGVKYSENNRPILDVSGNSSSVYDRYLFISVILKPFMQSDPNNALIEYRISDN